MRLPLPPEDEPETLLQRSKELALFYQKHHPRKVEDAARLVKSFDFEDIRKALMRKYGTLPSGWDPLAGTQIKTEVRSFETKYDEVREGSSLIAKPRPYTVFNVHVVATMKQRPVKETISKDEGAEMGKDKGAALIVAKEVSCYEKRWIVQKRYSELRLVHHLLRECRLPSDAPFPPAIPSLLINDALLEVSFSIYSCSMDHHMLTDPSGTITLCPT